MCQALAPFKDFRCDRREREEELFHLDVCSGGMEYDDRSYELLETVSNDLGNVSLLQDGQGYLAGISYGDDAAYTHYLRTDSSFTSAKAFIATDDRYAGLALSSMLRILFAQSILRRGGISVHASCIECNGKGYLFLGKSGTGKSTHSALWMKTWPECSLLNDDNPVIRLQDDGIWVYGTPWSGKTPCYRNRGIRLGGIVRLEQAGRNRFMPLDSWEGFMIVLPSCSAIHSNPVLQDALCDNLVRICGKVPVGRLECLPDTDAARTCRKGLEEMMNI